MITVQHSILSVTGELSHHTSEVDWDTAIGPEGRARVRLDPRFRAAAWVNDCGALLPDRYPRTIEGSCLLAALGAAHRPYFGPIVFTGWKPENTPLGLSEIVPLAMPSFALDDIYGDVRRALHEELPSGATPEAVAWCDAVRLHAEHVRTAPTPGITAVGTGPDMNDFLFGGTS
ncbi:hypothetical protein ACFWPV_10205 [Streptomyces uncialis]|uniref:hypothetical protein n=1 Tax=Streptomyces uncialis TaxID=1048205 RepID=UPI003653E20B